MILIKKCFLLVKRTQSSSPGGAGSQTILNLDRSWKRLIEMIFYDIYTWSTIVQWIRVTNQKKDCLRDVCGDWANNITCFSMVSLSCETHWKYNSTLTSSMVDEELVPEKGWKSVVWWGFSYAVGHFSKQSYLYVFITLEWALHIKLIQTKHRFQRGSFFMLGTVGVMGEDSIGCNLPLHL